MNTITHLDRIKILFSTALIAVVFMLVAGGFFVGKSSQGFRSDFQNHVRIAKLNFSYAFNNLIHLNFAAVGLFGQEDKKVISTSGEAQAVPVLLYHGEGDRTDMKQEQFRDQMKALYDDGWRTVTLDQFEQFMQGKGTLPKKSFLLTFDDGRSDSFYNSDPVLKDFNFNAIMFVITGFSMPNNSSQSIEKFYLSKTELQYMTDSGRWDLQSHGDQDHRTYSVPSATSTSSTLSYIGGQRFLSNRFWNKEENRLETVAEYTDRVTNDLETSKKILEEDFGKPVTAFAYPFNDYGQDTANFPASKSLLNTIAPSVYSYTFYQVSPTISDIYNYPDPNTYMIKRIEPNASLTGEQLVALLDMAGPKDLPYKAKIFGTEWINDWGKIDESNGLNLSAVPASTGASTILNGSLLWRDYKIEAQMSLQKGTDENILVRYKNERNRVACVFLDNAVFVQQTLDGVQTIVGRSSQDFVFDANLEQKVGSIVVGNYIGCTVGGKIVAAAKLDTSFTSGGVGFSTWDKQFNVATMHVSSIDVSEANDAAPIKSFIASQTVVAIPTPTQPTPIPTTPTETTSTSTTPTPTTPTPSNPQYASIPLTTGSSYTINDFNSVSNNLKALYGSFKLEGTELTITSPESNTSSAIKLQGTDSWQYYDESVVTDWYYGQSVGLIGGMQDSANYVECVFSNYGNSVSIRKVVNGVSTSLGRGASPIPYAEPWKHVPLGIHIGPEGISCSVYGKVVITDSLQVSAGAIGFDAWSSQKGLLNISILSLTAKGL